MKGVFISPRQARSIGQMYQETNSLLNGTRHSAKVVTLGGISETTLHRRCRSSEAAGSEGGARGGGEEGHGRTEGQTSPALPLLPPRTNRTPPTERILPAKLGQGHPRPPGCLLQRHKGSRNRVKCTATNGPRRMQMLMRPYAGRRGNDYAIRHTRKAPSSLPSRKCPFHGEKTASRRL